MYDDLSSTDLRRKAVILDQQRADLFVDLCGMRSKKGSRHRIIQPYPTHHFYIMIANDQDRFFYEGNLDAHVPTML